MFPTSSPSIAKGWKGMSLGREGTRWYPYKISLLTVNCDILLLPESQVLQKSQCQWQGHREELAMTESAFQQCPNRNLGCGGDGGGKRQPAHCQPVISIDSYTIDNSYY